MMRTEDEARVSLDETFTSSTPSPEKTSEKSCETRPNEQSIADGKHGKPARPPLISLLHALFGPFQPAFGGEQWETACTSWLLPDLVHQLWRVTVFATILGVYIALARQRDGSLQAFSTDVYTIGLVTAALLLVPHGAVCLMGPHEDDLDARGMRWLWSVVVVGLQQGVTFVVFMCVCYFVIMGREGNAVHMVPMVMLGLELGICNARMRVSYAVTGSLCGGIYIGVVRLGGGGVGPWFGASLVGKRGVKVLGMALLYTMSALTVVMFGRMRMRVAEWMEKRREMRN